jgi:hypothetical protein
MEKRIGQELLREKVVTEKQVEKALERQKFQGGRLGHNLVALGFITPDKLDTFFKRHPTAPRSVEASRSVTCRRRSGFRCRYWTAQLRC